MGYWFKPKRFWNWFAFYVPVSAAGWIATIAVVAAAALVFRFVDSNSHSSSDTLIAFSPWAIALLIFFDFLCFRFGEYPSWWRKIRKN